MVAGSEAFDMTNRDYTIFARIKTEHGGTIFSRTARDGPWVQDGKALFIRDGRLAFDICNIGCVQSVGQVGDGLLHEVAMTHTHDDHRIVLFIDGKPDRQGTLAPKQDAPAHIVRIGYTAADFPRAQNCFIGRIWDIRFYQQALTLQEIAALSTTEPGGAPLVARWILDPLVDASIHDQTGHGHEGTPEIGPEAAVLLVNQNQQSSPKERDRPDTILKRRGLISDAPLWLLEGETDVAKATKQAQALAQQLAEWSDWTREIAEQGRQNQIMLDAAIEQCHFDIKNTNREMDQLPRFRGQFYNNEVAEPCHQELLIFRQQTEDNLDILNKTRNQPFKPESKREADTKIKDFQTSYNVAREGLGRLVSETRQKYKSLATDGEITSALHALGNSARLGPSAEFEKNARWLEEHRK